MSRDEAKLILCAWQPGAEEENPGYFDEALALLSSDPELAAWWQAQQAFDHRMAENLAEIPVPAGLRARIQEPARMIAFPRPFLYGLAAAAAVAILAVAAWRPWTPHAMGPDSYTSAVLATVQQDPVLPMNTPDRKEVVDWLGSHRSPTGDTLPGPLATMPSLGCKTLSVAGHPVSLICFSSHGAMVHLFIVDRGAIAEPQIPLVMGKQGEWATAAWDDGTRHYLLVSRGGIDVLKSVLGT